ncbi:hypothetical protein [Streptomyces sp. NPDC003247]|uniref:hypothetical protein n=1 Tax=Streptomyces sp. NPDC003247 TaxID=3364677 RepID=UPI0036A1925B
MRFAAAARAAAAVGRRYAVVTGWHRQGRPAWTRWRLGGGQWWTSRVCRAGCLRCCSGSRGCSGTWLAHLLETETGYRSGSAFWAEEGEPRLQFDPARTTLTQRRAAKVAELAALPGEDANRQISARAG